MAYDKNTDYQAIINEAVAKGDLVTARAAEQSRNAKIADMNKTGSNTNSYTQTYNYNAPSGFTGSTSVVGGGVSSGAQSIIDQMNQNSKLWYSDPNNRAQYEAQNKALGQQLSGMYEQGQGYATTYTPKYDAATGTWTVTPNHQSLQAPANQTGNAQRPNLMGTALGDMYGLTYDRQQILDILNKAAQTQYDFKNQEYQQTENRFYGNLLTTQGTALDTMRRAQAAAVATGATRGMAAANELSAVLGLQQEGVGAATELAQERNNLASEHAANMAENENTALTTSNTLKQAIAQLALSKYGYDTQGYIGDLDYLAALKDIEASMYQADKTLEGVKYNADANVAAAGKASGSGTTGGTGRATWGSIKNYWESDPGIKADSSAMEDLNENIKKGDGSWSPDEQSYTIHGLDPNTNKYRIETSEGTLSLTPEQMTKLKNSDWDLTSATDANYGSWGYDKSYDTGSTKSWTEAQAIDYFKKNGKNPPGWQVNDLGSSQNPTTGSGVNRIYRAYYVGDKQDNTFAITNQQGQKISVGYGTGASTWTYNTTTGMWSNTTGTSLNQKNFQAYLEKQNPMYVKKLN